MKIYCTDSMSDEYQSFEAEKNYPNLFSMFKGKSLKGVVMPKLHIYEDYRDKKKGDFPYFHVAPVFSEKAVEILKEFLKGKVELFPIEVEGDKYFIVNVINVLDCIDYEKSDIKYFKRDPNKIMDIKKHVFKQDVVQGQHIFTIKETNFVEIFVSTEFVNAIMNSELEGCQFIKVWDSEE